MGSKKTTNVTNETGLGDDQFTTLTEGQEGISGQVTDLSSDLDTRADSLDDAIGDGFQDVDRRFDTVDRNIGTLDTDISTGFGNVRDDISGLGTDMTQAFDRQATTIDTGFDNLGTQVGNVGDAITTNVDARTGELRDQLTTGFTDAATNLDTGLADLRDSTQTGQAALGSLVSEGQQALGEQATRGFENVGSSLEETKAAILSGQGDINTLMNQFGGNLDAYASSLLEGQAAARDQVGAIQGGLDEFANQYSDDFKLAAQQRNELQGGIEGGFLQAERQAGNIADAAALERLNLSQNILDRATDVANVVRDSEGNVISAAARALTDSEGNIVGVQNKTFTRIAKELAVGFDDGTAESRAAKQDFVNRLNTVKNVLASQGDTIDAGLRKNYTDLVNSFDQTGKLIARSSNNLNNRVSRALDAQGNLLIATFNDTGSKIDQQSLSINAMMGQLEKFGYRPGSNVSMGTLSPTSNEVGQNMANTTRGLMTPFTRTRQVA